MDCERTKQYCEMRIMHFEEKTPRCAKNFQNTLHKLAHQYLRCPRFSKMDHWTMSWNTYHQTHLERCSASYFSSPPLLVRREYTWVEDLSLRCRHSGSYLCLLAIVYHSKSFRCQIGTPIS